MMGQIVNETEHQIRIDPPVGSLRPRSSRLSVAETICECMAHAADDLDVSAIAIFTETGGTAACSRSTGPPRPLRALSYEKVINRSMLLWGTYPILCSRFHDTDMLVNMAEEILEKQGYVRQSQVLGIVAGTRTRSGATNFMRLHMVGDRDTETVKAKKAKKKKR